MTSELSKGEYVIGRQKFDPIEFIRAVIDNKILTLVIELPSSYLTYEFATSEYVVELAMADLFLIKKALLSNFHVGNVHHIVLKYNKEEYYTHIFNTIGTLVPDAKRNLNVIKVYETELINYAESYNILHSIKYNEICAALNPAPVIKSKSADTFNTGCVDAATLVMPEQQVDTQIQSLIDDCTTKSRYNNKKVAVKFKKLHRAVKDTPRDGFMHTFKAAGASTITKADTTSKEQDVEASKEQDVETTTEVAVDTAADLVSEEYVDIGTQPVHLDARFSNIVDKYTSTLKRQRSRNHKRGL